MIEVVNLYVRKLGRLSRFKLKSKWVLRDLLVKIGIIHNGYDFPFTADPEDSAFSDKEG